MLIVVDFGRADSFLRRAYNKISEAEAHLKQYHWSESVSASQECMELSLKALYLDSGFDFTKSHDLKEEEFLKILKKVPKDLEGGNYPRLYLLARFWSGFYTISKYGIDRFNVGSDKLFKEGEAKLAFEHAKECYWGSNSLHSQFKRLASSR